MDRRFGVIHDKWQFCRRTGEFETRKKSSVKTLHEWMVMESEYQTGHMKHRIVLKKKAEEVEKL